MKKLFLAMAVVFSTCSVVSAADPVSNTIRTGNFQNPTSSSTRTNINLYFQDETGANIHQPDSLIKVWAHFKTSADAGVNCGADTATATLVSYNGQTVVMKKKLDYTFVVPMVKQYWAVDINTKILEPVFLGQCFQIAGYDLNGNAMGSDGY